MGNAARDTNPTPEHSDLRPRGAGVNIACIPGAPERVSHTEGLMPSMRWGHKENPTIHAGFAYATIRRQR